MHNIYFAFPSVIGAHGRLTTRNRIGDFFEVQFAIWGLVLLDGRLHHTADANPGFFSLEGYADPLGGVQVEGLSYYLPLPPKHAWYVLASL